MAHASVANKANSSTLKEEIWKVIHLGGGIAQLRSFRINIDS